MAEVEELREEVARLTLELQCANIKLESIKRLLADDDKPKRRRSKRKYNGPERPERLELPEKPTHNDYVKQVETALANIDYWDNFIKSGELNARNTKFAKNEKEKQGRWLARMQVLANDSASWAEL